MSYAIASSTSAVRGEIEPLIETVWTTLGFTTETIQWPNAYFVKPGNGAWIRVSYPQRSTVPFTWSGAGIAQNQTTMLLAIQVFTPRNAGDAVLIAAMDGFRATFERQSFGAGIRFREATDSETAFEQQWAGRSLTFPFEFIEDIQQ